MSAGAGGVPGEKDAEWWDSLTDDEREATLASANTGSADDFSYLDDEGDTDG